MFIPINNAKSRYEITKSFKFNGASHISNNAHSTSLYTVHLAFWCKRTKVRHNVNQCIFAWYDGATQKTQIYFDGNDKLCYLHQFGGTTYQNISSTSVLSDTEWVHYYIVFNPTIQLYEVYVDGVIQPQTITTNTVATIGQIVHVYRPLFIGSDGNSANYFDGYMADIRVVYDNSSVNRLSSFGNYSESSGGFKPVMYTGSYGDRGLYLRFNNVTDLNNLLNESTGVSKTNAGAGGTNSLTPGPNYCISEDVPTKSYAHLGQNNYNAGYVNASYTYNGGLVTGNSFGAAYAGWSASLPMTRGKYYYELMHTGGTYAGIGFGLVNGITSAYFNSYGYYVGQYVDAWSYFSNGYIYNNAATSSQPVLPTYTTNDIIGCAFDADNYLVIFYKNGTEVVRFNVPAGEYLPLFHQYQLSLSVNFGSTPAFSSCKWYPEADGWFVYQPPSGYKSLNTKSLWGGYEAIRKPSNYANIYQTTYLTSAVASPTLAFTPGLLIYNNKVTGVVPFRLADIISTPSGTGSSVIQLNATNTAVADATFALNSSNYTLNLAGATDGDIFNGFAFKTSSPYTNTRGSIASTVSTSPESGVSIVRYTGNGQISTVGHGLSTRPKMIWIKAVTGTPGNTKVYFEPDSSYATHSLELNTTVAATLSNDWNNTLADSSRFTIGTTAGVNTAGVVYMAYCFADVPGYLKIGKFTGIGVQAATYIPCGFKPQLLMVKCYSTTGNWQIVNSARNTYNEVNRVHFINGTGEAMDTNRGVHFQQNGFKLSRSSADWNASNYYYLYMAIAKHPARRSFI